MAKSTHVVPNKDKGGWDIKQSGGQRSSGHFDTKKKLKTKLERLAETKKLN